MFLLASIGHGIDDTHFTNQPSQLERYQSQLVRSSDSLYLENRETERRIREILERKTSKKLASNIANAVITVHNEIGVDAWTILAFIRVENSYLNPNIVNHYGAVGLMQVVERIHWGEYPECGTNSLKNVYTNICYGSKIYLDKLRIADGNERLAKWLYNGCSAWRRKRGESCIHYPNSVDEHESIYEVALKSD